MTIETLKKVLRGLVVSASSPMGIIPLNSLLRDYQEVEGRRIPYADLGFRTEMDLLHSIPDTIEVGALC